VKKIEMKKIEKMKERVFKRKENEKKKLKS
jgi:hypothetical protein